MAIQNYTFADFYTETQLRLNDPFTGGLWNLTDLGLYINRALLRVAMDVRLTRKDAPISVVAGLAVYSYPSDYMIPEFLYCSALLGNQRLYPTTLGQIDKRMEFVRVQQIHNAQLRPAIMAPGRAFDRKHANPEVIRDFTRWGYR